MAAAGKNKGCLWIFILALMIWLAGSWLLWQASLRAPADDEETVIFEIIPRSTESSVVEDDENEQTIK